MSTQDPLRPTIGDVISHFGLSVGDVLGETDAPDEIVADQLGLDPTRIGPDTDVTYLAYEAGMTPAEVVEMVPSIHLLSEDDIDYAVRFVRRKTPSGKYDDVTIQDAMELVAADKGFGRLTGSVQGSVISSVTEGEGQISFETSHLSSDSEHDSPFMKEAVNLIPELGKGDFWAVRA